MLIREALRNMPGYPDIQVPRGGAVAFLNARAVGFLNRLHVVVAQKNKILAWLQKAAACCVIVHGVADTAARLHLFSSFSLCHVRSDLAGLSSRAGLKNVGESL